ncbi:hypothetical protein DFJ73DRAFT_958824 [Zopfochytrium polystomum]|nr:hypothetical protein DFJ73DRAFT_958824 [Zopfochytrium polystomum]
MSRMTESSSSSASAATAPDHHHHPIVAKATSTPSPTSAPLRVDAARAAAWNGRTAAAAADPGAVAAAAGARSTPPPPSSLFSSLSSLPAPPPPLHKAVQRTDFHAAPDSLYIMPASFEGEVGRLNVQHVLLRTTSGALFHSDAVRSLLQSASASATSDNHPVRVLDMGCGPRFNWTAEVARAYPAVSFVGARLLIGSVPATQWPAVIRELVRITKPGGFIELGESCVAACRAGPKGEMHNEALLAALRARGLDPEAGLHLPEYCAAAGGLMDLQSGQCSLPVGWNGAIGALGHRCIAQSFEGLRSFLSTALTLTDDEYDAFTSEFLEECVVQQSFFNFYWTVGRVVK